MKNVLVFLIISTVLGGLVVVTRFKQPLFTPTPKLSPAPTMLTSITTSTPVALETESNSTTTQVSVGTPPAHEPSGEQINLPVPFVPEAPDGIMVKPWNNACEEASIVMADLYYAGKTSITKEAAKSAMMRYFAIEDELFGQNANTDAKETARLINEFSHYFEATIKDNPTLEDIKNELRNGRPVISLHHGQGLQNPHTRFARTGSYYHMLVIKGFDDATSEFLTNDDGDHLTGLDYRYTYATLLGTLHDYNHATRKTDGTPRVLFTRQRILAQDRENGTLYLIRDQKKYPLTPELMKQNNWNLRLITPAESAWLDQFEEGDELPSAQNLSHKPIS